MSELQHPTFLDNVEAFVGAIGPTEPGLVLDLAQAPWPTSIQRDEFIDALTLPPKQAG